MLLGLLGMIPDVARRSRMASAAGSFLVLNAAAWVAFWVWASGQTCRAWTKTVYHPTPVSVKQGVPRAFEGAAR